MSLCKQYAVFVSVLWTCLSATAQDAFNRQAWVQRHNIHIHTIDSLSSLTVGNGGFAFTVDITGLQSFPEDYVHGIPLGTMSDWGWHSFPNDSNYKIDEAVRCGRSRFMNPYI